MRAATATVEVLGLPFEGCHTDPFHQLTRRLEAAGAGCTVSTVVLPGHGRLLQEDALGSIGDMADWVCRERGLLTGPRRRLALLGYSSGSLVAFEVARRLVTAGRPPAALLVNASSPPHLVERSVLDLGTEEGMAQHITDRGFMPAGALASPQLRRLVLPTLRADVLAVDRYRCSAETLPALGPQTLVQALTGADDLTVREPARWSEVTTGPARVVTVPGGHYFIHDSARQLVELTSSAVLSLAGRS